MVSISPIVSVGQVVELEEHRPVAALQLAVELQHHLAAPVVALDEALPSLVGGVAAERPRDVGAGRAVVVLDQRVDLEALEVGELGAGVIGHRVAVAGVGRVLVGAEQVARGRQAEPAGGAAGTGSPPWRGSTRNSPVRRVDARSRRRCGRPAPVSRRVAMKRLVICTRARLSCR